MYCHACGRPLPPNAAFCPACGAAQFHAPAPPPPSTVPSALIVLALIFFFPAGLILMWTASDWSDDAKWAVSGIFFPPLWLRFLWKVWWLPYAISGLIAWLVLRGYFEGGLSLFGAVALLTVVAVILTLTHPKPKRKPQAPDPTLELRRIVEAKLDSCNDLIAQIESTLDLDLAPTSSTRRRYIEALELRSEATRLLDQAPSHADLWQADRNLNRALHELRAIKDGIADEHQGHR